MIGLAQEGSDGTTITPYGGNDDAGPRLGVRTTCELCGNTRVCFSEYDLVACRDCHHDLLPGSGVL